MNNWPNHVAELPGEQEWWRPKKDMDKLKLAEYIWFIIGQHMFGRRQTGWLVTKYVLFSASG